MILFTLICCGIALFASNAASPPPARPERGFDAAQSVTAEKMTVRWRIDGAMLHCVMAAPTKGWLAIGFNTHDQLANTNLIMGCVRNGVVAASDRFIVAPGLHKAISELGGTEALSDVRGSETAAGTTIQFSIPLKPSDTRHHQLLTAGNSYTLLMAYGVEDDFAHHSIMRTSVQITL